MNPKYKGLNTVLLPWNDNSKWTLGKDLLNKPSKSLFHSYISMHLNATISHSVISVMENVFKDKR